MNSKKANQNILKEKIVNTIITLSSFGILLYIIYRLMFEFNGSFHNENQGYMHGINTINVFVVSLVALILSLIYSFKIIKTPRQRTIRIRKFGLWFLIALVSAFLLLLCIAVAYLLLKLHNGTLAD